MVDLLAVIVIVLGAVYIAQELIKTYNTIQLRKELQRVAENLESLNKDLNKKGKK